MQKKSIKDLMLSNSGILTDAIFKTNYPTKALLFVG
jgi:hypothetical protein